MNPASSTIVQRVWNYCNVLRDDGISYGDYVEQLTYLLFLKMDYEGSTMLGKKSAIPAELNWSSLLSRDGTDLEAHYLHILKELGSGSGLIPTIFRKAQNKIQDPAKLKRLITLINGEVWVGLDIDTKGEIYEGLLEKNAQDTKSGAGQYFTPRPLIQAMVEVMRPEPGQTICDPAAGTGGFLLAAHEYITKKFAPLDKGQLEHLNKKALHGWEIAQEKILSRDYDVIVLDEFTYAMHFGWLDTIQVIDWLKANKPDDLHLIITGRDAPQALIDYADLVTEMREVKHPFAQGIQAQPGIEF